MNDENEKNPPEENEERTVFVPGGTEPPAPEPSGESDLSDPTPPPVEPEASGEAAGPSDPAPPEPAPEAPAAGVTPTFSPRSDAVSIKVGDVLNHIFEVKRFLARGGMGEVFEGCNVNTDEKVAIKVMLPALVNDEKVVAMFRKEARTLTKLHHPALVQYRVLAQEPQLGVLYIVTDFIDGTNLSQILGDLKPSPADLAGLLKRLAAGLGAAHQLGAVHRDMSPDNVILSDNDIHKAKIIDFGIAKDLDASSATIVGDGFAGKLNYVAPEQLGDYGREIGPWTDVYSLGLLILAVAQGKNVDMSGSLVDAIDKRRRGPDLSAIPPDLLPLVQAMLRPDPKERLRSMDDVVAMLDGARVPGPTTVRESAPPPVSPANQPESLSTPARSGGGAGKAVAIGAGAVVLLAAIAGGAYYGGLIPGVDDGNQSGNVIVNPDIPRTGTPVERATAAINSVVPSVSCTWLDIGTVEEAGSSVRVSMRGVAGDPNAAQNQLRSALTQAGFQNPTIEFGDVAPITQAGCAALDTYRQIRAPNGTRRLVSPEPRYEMTPQRDGQYAGREAATAPLELDVSDATRDFALLAIEPSGTITVLLQNRAQFEQALASSVGGRPISRVGNGRYRVHIDSDHQGWSGVLLISGRGPFDTGLIQPGIGARGPDWTERLLSAAAAAGWQAEMAWYESVNRTVEPVGGGTVSANNGGTDPVGADYGGGDNKP